MLSQHYGLDATHRSYVVHPVDRRRLPRHSRRLRSSTTSRGASRRQVLVITRRLRADHHVRRSRCSRRLPPIWLIVVMLCVFSFGSGLSRPARGAITSQVTPPNVRTRSAGALGGLFDSAPLSHLDADGASASSARSASRPCSPSACRSGSSAALIDLSAAPLFDLDRRNAFAAAMADEEIRRSRAAEGRQAPRLPRRVAWRTAACRCSSTSTSTSRGRDHRAARHQRRRQVDAAARHLRTSAKPATAPSSSTAATSPTSPPHEIAARSVICMPGGRGVFPGPDRARQPAARQLADDTIRPRCATASPRCFEIFPILRERADVNAATMSGGEQQMLTLALAFLAKPKLLMIDELSLGLSPAVVGELIEIVKEIHSAASPSSSSSSRSTSPSPWPTRRSSWRRAKCGSRARPTNCCAAPTSCAPST